MLKPVRPFLFAVVSVLFCAPKTVQAGIGACGDIQVEANAQCEVIAPGVECEGECTPISVEAACSAKLAIECEGECTATAEMDCNTSCQADCFAECEEFEPGEFDCAASCNADCAGRCQGHCEADEDSASCQGECEASCSASCDADCDVELPHADCDAGCEASCNGSCTAEANFDCQIDCQRESYLDCEAEVQGGCKLACETEEGALFCDGNYIDHGDNLDECIAALRAMLDIRVEAYSKGSCEGNTCSGEVGASCECSAMPGRSQRIPSVPLMVLMILGMVFSIWRRRKFSRET